MAAQLNVTLNFSDNDEYAGRIIVKKVTVKKPRRNATSTTFKIKLKGTDKASKKVAKQLNKSLKRIPITLIANDSSNPR